MTCVARWTSSAEPSEVTKDRISNTFIRFSNIPCLVGMSVDLNNDVENVDMALALPGGSEPEGLECTLSPDGAEARISFDWPKSLYDIKKLYEEELAAGERIDSTIQSFKEALKSRRAHAGIALHTRITIPLPTPVQTDGATWTRNVKRTRDGAIIVKVKFLVRQKA